MDSRLQDKNRLFSEKSTHEHVTEIKIKAFLDQQKLVDELIENSLFRLADLDNNYPPGVSSINIANLTYYCIAAVKGNIQSLQKISNTLPGNKQKDSQFEDPFINGIKLCQTYTVELDEREVNNAINLIRNNIVFEELKSFIIIIKQKFLIIYSNLDKNSFEQKSCCTIC